MTNVKIGRRATLTSSKTSKAMAPDLDEKLEAITPLLMIIVGAILCGLTCAAFLWTAIRDMTSAVYSAADAPADLVSAVIALVLLAGLMFTYKHVKLILLSKQIKRQMNNCSIFGRRS